MDETAFGRVIKSLVDRCAGMDQDEADALIDRFIEENANVEVVCDDSAYDMSDVWAEDPRASLHRRVFSPKVHNLEYAFGPAETPSMAEVRATELHQEAEMRSRARAVGVTLGRDGRGGRPAAPGIPPVPKALSAGDMERMRGRALKRRAARAGRIPKKGS